MSQNTAGPDARVLGENVVRQRKIAGWTQETLAELVGVSPQAVSKWENGRALPELSQLYALAKLFDTGMDELLRPEDIRVISAVCHDTERDMDVRDRVLRHMTPDGRLSVDRVMQVSALGRLSMLAVVVEVAGVKRALCACEGEVDLRQGELMPDAGLTILACRYGNAQNSRDGMAKVRHYEFFRWNAFPANHESFPVGPEWSGEMWLLMGYMCAEGAFVVSCAEGESLEYTTERTRLRRKPALDGERLLPGIPALKWKIGMDCTWAGAMTACLSAMGVSATYDEVMGKSGACYRVAFCAPKWDYSSVDGLVTYDFLTPLKTAYGLDAEILSRVSGPDRDAAKARVLADINRGVPTAAINLRVAPEWGVISGYVNRGETLLCRSYFDDDTCEAEGGNGELMSFLAAHDGMFPADNWPFLLIRFCGRPRPLDDRACALASLRVLIDCMNAPGRGYHAGHKAYHAWADGLSDDALFDPQSFEDARRRQSVHHFCLMALRDARRSAHSYLSAQDGLSGIAAFYEKSHSLAESMFLEVSDGYHEPHKAFTRDIRLSHAASLREMDRLETQAEALARTMIETAE